MIVNKRLLTEPPCVCAGLMQTAVLGNTHHRYATFLLFLEAVRFRIGFDCRWLVTAGV